jgi:hypothetical protein
MLPGMQDARLAAGVFGVSLAYAIVRYNVFGTVDWQQLPVFVTNKAISVASLVMLGMSRIVVDKTRRKKIGLIGAALAGLHVVLSMMLMTPSYLAKLYLPSGTMTGSAELSMLVGAVATILIGWLLYETILQPVGQQTKSSLVRGLGRFVLILVAAHVAFIGWGAWFDLSKWPGRLPPITLLSAAIAAGFCFMPRSR